MDVDLTPKVSKSVYGGDGGSYSSWSPSDLPMLKEGNIGASKIALQKNGLAMPSYSDSAKVAYVLQGKGTAGIYLYETEKEKVVSIKEGDAMALPFGVTTWWFNQDDTELVILFMGNTCTGHKAGEFTEFPLTGANGLFTGFTTEFVARAWDLEEDKVKELVGSQKGTGIVKVKDGFKMPEPKEEDRKGMVMNCLEAPLDVDIKNGGRVVLLNTKSLPLVKDVGLGADLVRFGFFAFTVCFLCNSFILIIEILDRIDAGSMCSPGFSCDSAYQEVDVLRLLVSTVSVNWRLESRLETYSSFPGSSLSRKLLMGRVWSGFPSSLLLSKLLKQPVSFRKFSIKSDYICFWNFCSPIFCHLAGRTSVWKALSPEVLQASFNVSPEAEQHFRSKRLNAEIFFPAP
ncbi:hypothetical protein MKW94_028731 [Papaver nudicaule]|uniref:Cupin type-1 domain-containing protein n=1 Tax=Papaver nudicaule TaxID=74823 RepID=A0AA41RS51_PAPNU|nr:hypothetical protein [Papaver nudicaule]